MHSPRRSSPRTTPRPALALAVVLLATACGSSSKTSTQTAGTTSAAASHTGATATGVTAGATGTGVTAGAPGAGTNATNALHPFSRPKGATSPPKTAQAPTAHPKPTPPATTKSTPTTQTKPNTGFRALTVPPKKIWPQEATVKFMGVCEAGGGPKALCECVIVYQELRPVPERIQTIAEVIPLELAIERRGATMAQAIHKLIVLPPGLRASLHACRSA